mgnify:FL=1
MITKIDYEKLKEYWDFQRKKQYQKDWIRAVVKKASEFAEILGNDGENEMIDYMYSNLEEKDYQQPPINYVPDDVNFRIEGEDYDDWCRVRQNIQMNNTWIWRKENANV